MSEHLVDFVTEPDVTVHRIVDFSLDGDGRTLETRVIPWNIPTQVSDPPHFQPYQESWAPGAFDRQLSAANRVDVLMNFEHHQGISNIVGRGLELTNESDGLHGTFRMLNGQDADKALELVNEGVLTGLSVEAVVKRSDRIDGLVVRKDARLVNVALCRTPAYKGAQVLAVREASHDGAVEAVLDELTKLTRERIVIPPPLDRERFEALGIKVPDRTPTDEVESPE